VVQKGLICGQVAVSHISRIRRRKLGTRPPALAAAEKRLAGALPVLEDDQNRRVIGAVRKRCICDRDDRVPWYAVEGRLHLVRDVHVVWRGICIRVEVELDGAVVHRAILSDAWRPAPTESPQSPLKVAGARVPWKSHARPPRRALPLVLNVTVYIRVIIEHEIVVTGMWLLGRWLEPSRDGRPVPAAGAIRPGVERARTA
jgi:hypothetical protein